MLERFDKQARLSVVLAQTIAENLGADHIHAGHLLLGLRGLGDEVTTKALDEAGVPMLDEFLFTERAAEGAHPVQSAGQGGDRVGWRSCPSWAPSVGDPANGRYGHGAGAVRSRLEPTP
jgi:hypothetical protein